jgi:hypothetical protein
VTAYRTDFVTLGGLTIGSRGLDVHDYDDLLSDAPMRGANRTVPGVAGRAVRPRQLGELRAALVVRLRGDWTRDNQPVATSGRVAQLYDHLAALRTVTRNTAVQTLTLQLDGGLVLSADCQVEDGGRFVREDGNAWAGIVVVDLTLPDGPLEWPTS